MLDRLLSTILIVHLNRLKGRLQAYQNERNAVYLMPSIRFLLLPLVYAIALENPRIGQDYTPFCPTDNSTTPLGLAANGRARPKI